MTQSEFEPIEVRFIKLGEGGVWEKSCIEEDKTIRLGFVSNQHSECLNEQWDLVRDFWLRQRNGSRTEATKDVNEIKAFYTQPSTTLWITFYNRLLYWCFAEEIVTEHPSGDGSRIRKTLNGWSCSSLSGTTLHVSNIDGRVSKVQGYRRTICAVERSDYLIRKIRGEKQPEVIQAKKSFTDLVQYVATLIRGLWWHDFELLADLIFVRSGWQRISVLGKTEKGIDIDLLSPITNRRAFVQVKSRSDYIRFRDALTTFRNNEIYDEMYFVVHTVQDNRIFSHCEDGVSVIGPDKLAELAINAGLFDWVIKKHE